jgi:beta-ribofuranosylaminobenzene 5'-phosphate synthase
LANHLTIVHSFPRIHIGLLDLGHITHRAHGGAGFCIDGLPVEIEIRRSRSSQIIGLNQLDADGRSDLRAAIARMRDANAAPKLTIQLRNVLPQHVGLGSKTATILGTLKALDLLLGAKLTDRRLQELSGRGGTSGVGINTFFTGGFVVDCGHAAVKDRKFVPSRRQTHFDIPPLACRINIPSDWRIHLFLLPGRRLASSAEAKFFRDNTPIPRREVLSAISVIYHGIVPAVISGDVRLLKECLGELHRTGFKSRELRNQAPCVRAFMDAVDASTNLAVGMSSLGPLVYAIGESGYRTGETLLKELCARYRGQFIGTFQGRSTGFKEIEPA